MRLTITFLVCLLLLSCRSTERRLSWIEDVLTLRTHGQHPTAQSISHFFDPPLPQSHPYLSSQFQEELDLNTHSRLSSGNEVELLPNAQSGELKLNLIREAKKSILISTFHIVCDEGGKQFTDALIQAVKRGVEVRFLITGGPWTWPFAGNCQTRMGQKNVQVATMPYSYITNHGVVQLHDKLFIVDSKIAIVGGQNIGSWFSKKRLEDKRFRDTDAIVSGPVVNDILKRFVMLWHFAKPADIGFQAPIISAQSEKYASWLASKPTQGLCRFVSQTPSQKEFLVFEAYRLYALQAQKRLIFHSLALNAFGSPEQENLWDAFVKVAQKPEAEVFLITNGPGFINSNIIPAWIGKIVGYYFLSSVYDSLRGTPIQAFAYPVWLHSKVYFFDNLAIGIGSFNFDETGLIWTESTLICLDEHLRQQTIQMFEKDLRDSYIFKNPSSPF